MSTSISELYSEAEIAEMQEWLNEHPIDHKYDHICDSLYDGFDVAVLQQSLSRSYYDTLNRLGCTATQVKMENELHERRT